MEQMEQMEQFPTHKYRCVCGTEFSTWNDYLKHANQCKAFQGKQTKDASKKRNEVLREEILDLVNGISREDERRALIDVILRRIEGYGREEIEKEIGKLVDEGELAPNRVEGELYLVRL